MAYDLLSDYCWVMVGSQRRKIMNCLSSEKLPSQVKKETGLPFSNVSRVLADMVEKELVSEPPFSDYLEQDSGQRSIDATLQQNI